MNRRELVVRILALVFPILLLWTAVPPLLAVEIPLCGSCLLVPTTRLDWIINLRLALPADQHLHQVALEVNNGTILTRDISEIIHAPGAPVVVQSSSLGSINVVPSNASPSSAMHGEFLLERTLSNLDLPQGVNAVDMHFRTCNKPSSAMPFFGLRCTTHVVQVPVDRSTGLFNEQEGELAPNPFIIGNAG